MQPFVYFEKFDDILVYMAYLRFWKGEFCSIWDPVSSLSKNSSCHIISGPKESFFICLKLRRSMNLVLDLFFLLTFVGFLWESLFHFHQRCLSAWLDLQSPYHDQSSHWRATAVWQEEGISEWCRGWGRGGQSDPWPLLPLITRLLMAMSLGGNQSGAKDDGRWSLQPITDGLGAAEWTDQGFIERWNERWVAMWARQGSCPSQRHIITDTPPALC